MCAGGCAGVEAMVAAMLAWKGAEGVQCNGCLALMSLVRGEGQVCQENQWRVAKVGGVEAIVAGMQQFPQHPMVQLSALLCMIPLALGALCFPCPWHACHACMLCFIKTWLHHPPHASVTETRAYRHETLHDPDNIDNWGP